LKYLLIAEKPSLMKDIKNSYNKHRSDINKKVGIVDFVSLSGHACRLIEPKEYEDWNKPWKDIDLPIIPTVFKIDAIPRMKKTIADIKKKIKEGDYDGIIVGTDADASGEGNGIYYLLSNYIGITKMHALRLFLDDQTDKGIFEAFMHMTDFYTDPKHVHMTEAYILRSHMDWLMGMNFTLGSSVKSGFTMRVGRVKAPTLKMVYDNCKAIDEFVPHTDFAVDANYAEGFSGSLLDEDNKQKRFETEEDADKFIKSLSKTATVQSFEKKKVKTGAPLLYSLSDLQQEAGAKYHYTPTQVLDIVQSLYEGHKIVSYPRTSGNYISEAKAENFPDLIKACSFIPELNKFTSEITAADISRAKKDKRMVNDKEVAKASHDALMPTGEIPKVEALSKEELNICILIYKRFLSHFMEDLEEEKVVLITDLDGNTFKSNGKTTVKKGWTEIYDKKPEDIVIPNHEKGDMLDVKEFMLVEKTTQPPKRYTQSSLIGAMTNAAKFIDDKQLKEALKEAEGLGQESSRAKIISDLIEDGYMNDKKGKSGGLYITDIGKRYIENLSGYSIINPLLSAEWEYKMKQLRQGLIPFETVYDEMISYVKETVKEIEQSDIKKSSWGGSAGTEFECPICHKQLMKGKYGWYCSGKKDSSCTFTISEEIASKKITNANVKELLTKGITKEISGFKSKTGKTFSARLKLKEDKIEFQFDKAEPKETKGTYQCPICGEEVISDKWAWKCKNGCGFSLNYKIAGKEIKESDLKELILNKKTKKISGFTSKTGKKFNASLVLQKDGTTKFDFN